MTFVPGRVGVTVPATSANLGPGYDCLGLALELRDELTAEVGGDSLVVEVTGEGAGEVPLDAAPPRGPGDGRGVRRDGGGDAAASAAPARTASLTRAGSGPPRRRSSAASPWRGRSSRTGPTGSGSTTAWRWPTRSRGTPTTSRRPCSVGSSSAARTTRTSGPTRRRSTRGSARSPSCPRPGCRPRWPAASARHRPPRGRRGQHRPRGAARRGARRRARAAARGTEDFLHQSYRRPRCRTRSPSSTASARTVTRPWCRVRVRPCWC